MSKSIDAASVAHMAALSRLAADDAEREMFARQFGDILEYMDVLAAVDTEGVEPLYSPVLHAPALREDVAERRRGREEMLGNAPERSEEFFMVPRIVG